MKTPMKLYDCTIALSVDISGRPLHTTSLKGISEMEVAILQATHEHERVTDLKVVGEEERDKRMEMFKLARKYGNQAGIFNNVGVALIEKTFSTKLVGFDDWLANQEEFEEQQREEARMQREAEAAVPAPVVAPAASVKEAEPEPVLE